MKVCLVANIKESDTGLLDESLSEFREIVMLERENSSGWRNVDSADLFVHLGSSWSVYWKSVSGPVAAEVALMRHAMTRGVPILGICFGAQVLSHSFGGIVERAKKTEIGWCDVYASADDSVLAGRWMQWHHDSFTAPDGFEVLAVNEAGVQAIRRGRSLGVQFHPEATVPMVSKWAGGDGVSELASLGISPSDLLEQTRLETLKSVGATRRLARWFLEDVAQGPVFGN
ncbi:MAG: type 1 glutamine amidotransferase [Actinomycetota bacterium]